MVQIFGRNITFERPFGINIDKDTYVTDNEQIGHLINDTNVVLNITPPNTEITDENFDSLTQKEGNGETAKIKIVRPSYNSEFTQHSWQVLQALNDKGYGDTHVEVHVKGNPYFGNYTVAELVAELLPGAEPVATSVDSNATAANSSPITDGVFKGTVEQLKALDESQRSEIKVLNIGSEITQLSQAFENGELAVPKNLEEFKFALTNKGDANYGISTQQRRDALDAIAYHASTELGRSGRTGTIKFTADFYDIAYSADFAKENPSIIGTQDAADTFCDLCNAHPATKQQQNSIISEIISRASRGVEQANGSHEIDSHIPGSTQPNDENGKSYFEDVIGRLAKGQAPETQDAAGVLIAKIQEKLRPKVDTILTNDVREDSTQTPDFGGYVNYDPSQVGENYNVTVETSDIAPGQTPDFTVNTDLQEESTDNPRVVENNDDTNGDKGEVAETQSVEEISRPADLSEVVQSVKEDGNQEINLDALQPQFEALNSNQRVELARHITQKALENSDGLSYSITNIDENKGILEWIANVLKEAGLVDIKFIIKDAKTGKTQQEVTASNVDSNTINNNWNSTNTSLGSWAEYQQQTINEQRLRDADDNSDSPIHDDYYYADHTEDQRAAM